VVAGLDVDPWGHLREARRDAVPLCALKLPGELAERQVAGDDEREAQPIPPVHKGPELFCRPGRWAAGAEVVDEHDLGLGYRVADVVLRLARPVEGAPDAPEVAGPIGGEHAAAVADHLADPRECEVGFPAPRRAVDVEPRRAVPLADCLEGSGIARRALVVAQRDRAPLRVD